MRIQTERQAAEPIGWLTDEALQDGLDTDFVGRHLHFLPEVGSTNDEARRLASSGAPEGTVVVTDHQTSGRGRLGRRWVAPPGSSLLLSVLFRPPLAPSQMQRLTMIAGLAVADSVEARTGLRVGLKWPNDVILGGAKAGGLLTEIGLEGQRVDYAVVGIGLNVNLDPDDLPRELLMSATSLSQELGRQVECLPLLRELLRTIETRYLALKAGRSPHAEWVERLVTLGRPVVVSTEASTFEGVAEGVNEDGALLVRLPNGHLTIVMAGDVTLRH